MVDRGARLPRSAPDLAPAGSPGAPDSVPASLFPPERSGPTYDGDNRATHEDRSKTCNHHGYPSAARQGFFWWEIDVTYDLLVVMSWLGIVRDLHPVPAHVKRVPTGTAGLQTGTRAAGPRSA